MWFLKLVYVENYSWLPLLFYVNVERVTKFLKALKLKE